MKEDYVSKREKADIFQHAKIIDMICTGGTKFANKEVNVKVNVLMKEKPVFERERDFLNPYWREKSYEGGSGGK